MTRFKARTPFLKKGHPHRFPTTAWVFGHWAFFGHWSLGIGHSHDHCPRASDHRTVLRRMPVGAAKSSTVSTGGLKASRLLQLRPMGTGWSTRGLSPINGPGTLVSSWASRLDAFSVYPVPT